MRPLIFILFLMSLATAQSSTPDHLIYLGTYTRSTGKGIYSVRLDPKTGKLSEPVLAAETANPSFIAFSPNKKQLYAVSESTAMAAAFNVEVETGKLSGFAPQDSAGAAPCHLVVDQTARSLIIAHYHTAIVGVLPIKPDGSLGPATTVIHHTGHSVNPTRQAEAHVHSVTLSPDNRFVIVCDLGLDKIFVYALDAEKSLLAPAEIPFVTTPPGSGPRHAAFSRDGLHLFVIHEMGNLLVAYRYNPALGTLTPLDSQSTLPADFKGESTTAEVRVHPNGKFVYGSNRGHDSIAAYRFNAIAGKLELIEIVPTGGKNPRNFALSPDGRWLVAANQQSDSLTVFSVDPETGKLARVEGSTAKVAMPVCVAFAR